MHHDKRILLEVRSDQEHGRGCLLGVASYRRIHGGFIAIHRDPRFDSKQELALSKFTGVIADIQDQAHADALAALKIPVIDLLGTGFLRDAVAVVPDEGPIARLIIEHFVERGFKHFGFVGGSQARNTGRYRTGFEENIASRGFAGHFFDSRNSASGKEMAAPILDDWLRSLPRPIGLMVCDDQAGLALLELCRQHDIDVPGQVAIVVIDHDLPRCELSAPALSTVESDNRRMGFLAASILLEMINGRSPTEAHIVRVAPRRLIIRGSSDALVVHDPVIARTIRIIRENATGRMNVQKLLSHLSISRATLERRFTKAVGHSPREQILRVRLARARQLLLETDYDLARIARMSGFKTAAHLSVRFKANTGRSPGQYRALPPA